MVLWVIVNATCMLVSNFDMMVRPFSRQDFCGTFHLGPVFAVCQSVVPGRMRALAAALVTLAATTVGQGFGPLAAGMLNDSLGLLYGSEAVRYSMVIGGCVSLLGAICFISATRYIRSDIAEAHA